MSQAREPMKSLRMYLTSAGLAFILAIGLFLLVDFVPSFYLINEKGRDIFFQLRHKFEEIPPESKSILLVRLDDETLARLQARWPYPRSLYAEALKQLEPFSPKAIGFDLIFSGSDFTPESDEQFAEALKAAGKVVIASHRTTQSDVGPFPLIRDSAWRVGVVDKPRDPDHVLRRAFLSLPLDGQAYRSWELEVFTKAFPDVDTSAFPQGSETLINYRVNFDEFPAISFWQLLEGLALKEEVDNKIILIGLVAEAFHDIHATPLGSMPGVSVNANTILTMMRRDFFSYAPRWATFLLTFLSFWVALLLTASSTAVLGGVLVLVLSLVYLGGTYVLFTKQVILDPWLLIVGMVASYLGAIVFRQTQLLLENLRLQEESARDPLTGFYNRRFLMLKLKAEFNRRIARHGLFGTRDEISVVMIDLDNFKLVNDSFGHAEGDRVLRTMGEAIRSSIRKDELICRYGGDEFCVILPATTIEDATKFAEKIRTIIADHPDLAYRTASGTDTIRVTGSIGVASVRGAKAMEHDQLLKAADRALYRAKTGGRNQVCVYDPEKDVIE